MFRARFLAFIAFLSVAFVQTTQASSFDLDHYKGKVVYLDFWASWCVPCRHSFPWMNKLHAKYADKGLVVIAVNLDESRKDAEQFLKANPADFHVIYDPLGKLAQKYDVKGMPSSYVYDRTGKLVNTHIGFKNKDADELRDFVVSVLKK